MARDLGLPGAAAVRVIGFENEGLNGIYERDAEREIRRQPVFIQGASKHGTPSTADGVNLMCQDARRCCWCVLFFRTNWTAGASFQSIFVTEGALILL